MDKKNRSKLLLFRNALQELAFSGGGVSNDANVDVATQFDAILCNFADSTEHLQEED
jgi:hypothetical protein